MNRNHWLAVAILLTLPVALDARKKPGAEAEPVILSAPTISATPVAVMIAGLDRDGDTRVTRAEFDAGVERSFRNGDVNADGQIALLELSGWAQGWLGNPGALPGQYDFDRDGDDRVSLDEFKAEFGRRFVELDRDKDGVLVRAELITLTAPRFQRPREGQRAPEPEQRRRR